MSLSEKVRAAATGWMADDPDPDTVAELEALVQSGDEEAVAGRFAGPLRFGTAGLRGLLGAGESRMNRKVVLRATAGLCTYLLETDPNARERGLCVAFDGRRKSRQFADDVASVALGMGIPVRGFSGVVPTPVLAYACLESNAAAGVMVTASHNPPDYNGYKVYWGNGAQIVPPVDAGIAAAIDAVGDVASIPRGDVDAVTLFDDAFERRYLDGVRALQIHPGLPRDLRIAYTAMHGVGNRFALAALADAGFSEVDSVAAQAEPDGAFPTVAFPNPEEAGAMDLVLALAGEKDADIVFANDPDADRLAVAVRDGDGYRQLSGNEVGCLLGHYLLDQGPAGDKRLVVNTIVSSPMLGAIADAHAAKWEPTLTGFKWIANRAMALEADGDARFVFGYEEALGYTVGTHVRDKDGVSTAVVVADMAAWCKSRGGTLLTELEVAWRRYGMYLSRQISQVLPGADGKAQIDGMMQAVRDAAPSEIAGRTVTSFADLASQSRRLADGTTEALSFPPGNVLAMDLDGGHRVMLRPSGTEPKLKRYFDVCVSVGEGESVADAKARGEGVLEELTAGLLAITG
ncbi:MAG: phospho-sugar mutase [Sandaracinaceae bacterium]